MSSPAPATSPGVDPRPVAGAGARAARVWQLFPPVLAYLLSQLLYGVAATIAGEQYLSVGSRVRADSGLYAAVAEKGYELYLCRTDPVLAPLFAPDAWCGTAGWFPLYPALMHVVGLVAGLGAYQSGLIITEVSLLATFFLLWRTILRAARGHGTADANLSPVRRHAPGLAVLALAALLPSGVYLHAVFPMALATFLALVTVHLLWSRRWWWAGLVGALVAASYPIGITVAALGLGTALVLLRRGELRGWAAVRAVLLCAGLPVLGLLAVFGVHQLTVGHWNGYMLIQDHYGNGVHDPLQSLFRLATEPSVIAIPDPPRHLIGTLNIVTDAELWWSLALVLLAVAAAVLAARRQRLHPVDVGLVLYAAAVFIAPLVAGSGVSQYRSHTLMLPALLVLRHLPVRVLWCSATLSAVIAFPMGVLFSVELLF